MWVLGRAAGAANSPETSFLINKTALTGSFGCRKTVEPEQTWTLQNATIGDSKAFDILRPAPIFSSLAQGN